MRQLHLGDRLEVALFAAVLFLGLPASILLSAALTG
jgi:hypothetical protein